jgi:hypothetical protein
MALVQSWMLTPESQWQFRVAVAYLTGAELAEQEVVEMSAVPVRLA